MGACVKFRQAAAQAACLRFIVDMVNLLPSRNHTYLPSATA